MRAIDLYSGVGGWSCGLQLCGIQIVKSYEIDKFAIKTNHLNSRHDCDQCDILKLKLDDLPEDIELVVGSPPCTQFSFSNRGGQGDLQKGLEHIKKFLEVVDYLKPRWWVMENVPRTVKIVKECFEEGGAFHQYSHLKPQFFVAKAELFGTPQRRRRALIGNLDFASLAKQEREKVTTLGEVIDAVSGGNATIQDPVYGIKIRRSDVSDLGLEECLDGEEERINRTLKTSHHIYNKMSFPDNETVPSRTLTATCTRVSRESIIVRDRSDSRRFRRLSIRERACLQGFPITYEFCSNSYAGKIKQIGNAIPPTLSFSIGCLVTNTGLDLKTLSQRSDRLNSIGYEQRPEEFEFDRKRIYSPHRHYRFSIDKLNFGSGVRFELTNRGTDIPGELWRCNFWFGTAKKILEVPLNQDLVSFLAEELGEVDRSPASVLEKELKNLDGTSLQRVWAHRGPAGLHPFQLSDSLTEFGIQMQQAIENSSIDKLNLLERVLQGFGPDPDYSINPAGKLANNASRLLGAFFICGQFNALAAPLSELQNENQGTQALLKH